MKLENSISYFNLVKTELNLSTELEIKEYVLSKPLQFIYGNVSYGSFVKNYVPRGEYFYSHIRLALLEVIRATGHLIASAFHRALFNEEARNLNVFRLHRALEKSYGHLLSMGIDPVKGAFYIERSLFHQKCYQIKNKNGFYPLPRSISSHLTAAVVRFRNAKTIQKVVFTEPCFMLLSLAAFIEMYVYVLIFLPVEALNILRVKPIKWHVVLFNSAASATVCNVYSIFRNLLMKDLSDQEQDVFKLELNENIELENKYLSVVLEQVNSGSNAPHLNTKESQKAWVLTRVMLENPKNKLIKLNFKEGNCSPEAYQIFYFLVVVRCLSDYQGDYFSDALCAQARDQIQEVINKEGAKFKRVIRDYPLYFYMRNPFDFDKIDISQFRDEELKEVFAKIKSISNTVQQGSTLLNNSLSSYINELNG